MTVTIVLCVALLASQCGTVKCGEAAAICRQIDMFYTTFCGASTGPSGPRRITGSPGKRGESGQKGDVGARGPQGPPGTVDYGQINANIDRQIATGFETLSAKVEDLSSRLDRTVQLLEANFQTSGICSVFYEGKCFRAILPDGDSQTVDLDKAAKMCENIGARLANVYNIDYYNKIAEYMRTRIPATRTWVTFWTGVTYNPSTGVLYLSNGTSGPSLPWHPAGYPSSTSSWTKININLNKDSSSSGNGILNYPASYARLGALCEF